MREAGNAEPMSGKNDGQSDEPAFGEDEVGLNIFELFFREPNSGSKSRGNGEIIFDGFGIPTTDELRRSESKVRNFERSDQPLFDAVRTEVIEIESGVFKEFADDGDIWDDVPGRAAARKDDFFHRDNLVIRGVTRSGFGRTTPEFFLLYYILLRLAIFLSRESSKADKLVYGFLCFCA